jgi:hypothetical protein
MDGANMVESYMNGPTDEWLEQVNEEFSRNDIPHRQRPWLALLKWSEVAGVSASLGDEDEKNISDWFEKNTKAGSKYLGPMFIGSFFYDSCFWPVFIPVVGGTVQLDAAKSLRTMPDSIKSRLTRDSDAFMHYMALWTACVDYGFGIEELIENKNISTFAQELLRSGDQQLSAAITLLHEDRPNPKAVESARMATEMFLKAFLAIKVGLTEKEAKDKVGHNLEKALDRCLAADSQSELQAIRSSLNCFPEIGDRYKGAEKTSMELWQGYGVAQFTGATLVRSFTARDVRKNFR